MNFFYTFKKKYLEKLRETKNIFDLEAIVDEPEGNLILEGSGGSTESYEINPEMFFWWLDRITGQFENEKFEEYDEDITGLIFHLNWKNDFCIIYYNDESKTKNVIFKEEVKREEFFHILCDLSKDLQKKMEKANPLIRETKTWKNYYFVNHYQNV